MLEWQLRAEAKALPSIASGVISSCLLVCIPLLSTNINCFEKCFFYPSLEDWWVSGPLLVLVKVDRGLMGMVSYGLGCCHELDHGLLLVNEVKDWCL